MTPALLFLVGVLCVVRVIERVLGAPHQDRPATPTLASNATPYRSVAPVPESPREDELYVPEPVARWSPGAALVLTWLAGTAILALLYGFCASASRARVPCDRDHASAR